MSGSLTRRLLATAMAIALVGAACGGDDAADTTTTAPTDTSGSVAPEPTSTTAAPSETAAPSDGRVVAAGDSVSVHYTGTLDSGEVFDSSVGGATLDFVAGAGQMIAGFDAAVIGMAVGDKKTVRLAPDEAYGERSDDLIIEVERSLVPEDVAVGQELVDGFGNVVVVVEVRDDVVLIDQNHPLAGEFLTFEIELISIN